MLPAYSILKKIQQDYFLGLILFALIIIGFIYLAIEYRPIASYPTDLIDKFGLRMKLIPEGEFTMGRLYNFPAEQPIHKVYLSSFYIDVYEVTNIQYKSCVEAGKCSLPLVEYSYTRPDYFKNPQFDNYPVIYVTWSQAKAFCEWRGARLPTEAEWEKAARGVDDRSYSWGNNLDCSKVNYNVCSEDTTEVGSYEQGISPYGLYDMSGNVWEWVSDWRSETYYEISPYMNPQGPNAEAYKVLRGGSWNGYYAYLSVTYRGRDNPVNATNDYGFRCARDATP
ncbi:Formylglycine-generating enzyme [Anaerolineales bacterium]|nr:Formylglycine-generating enzyme [Anaerolineales bacterium]